MSFNLNPMGLNGPPTNYVQPNTATPASNAAVASYPVGADEMSLPNPIPKHTPNDNPGKFYPSVPTVFYPQNLDAMKV